jgi:hypothetical protein
VYLEHKLLNIYQSKKYFNKVVKTNEIYYMFNMFFYISCDFWDNWTSQMPWLHFQIYIFNNHHGLPVTPKSWVICVIQLFMHPSPFISVDNLEYTAHKEPETKLRKWVAYSNELLTCYSAYLNVTDVHLSQKQIYCCKAYLGICNSM